VVGEIRLCRSSLADQTKCMSYQKAFSNSLLDDKIIIWHLSAFLFVTNIVCPSDIPRHCFFNGRFATVQWEDLAL
jgi:hypothetical protein